jgi:hypothetical protein
MCQVLHDWADEYCVTILKQLRDAAGPKTQLVVVERLIACACDEPSTHEIPGAELSVPPKPLFRTGVARARWSMPQMLLRVHLVSETSVCADGYVSQMLGLFNGQERTITALRSVLAQAGWKLIATHHDASSVAMFQKVIEWSLQFRTRTGAPFASFVGCFVSLRSLLCVVNNGYSSDPRMVVNVLETRDKHATE